MGDGLLAEFSSVVEAVQCAVSIQRSILESDAPADQRITLRIGINLGDIIVEGSDIYGDGVNVAARLEALAEPGGVCVSDAVHQQVRDRLELVFDDLGELEVKNINRPVRAWKWAASNARTGPGPGSGGDTLPLPDKPSIAVLPFQNMTGDPEQEFFADGITEDITAALTKFRWLFVIARNSAFAYKGRAVDIKDVGRELGVRYIIEGSVRKAGNRLRVSVQLVEASSGNHIKTERYDRVLEDMFEIQDEITELISGTLAPEISSAERKRVALKRPESLDAWGLLQRGLTCLWHFDKENLASAADYLEAAIQADSSFAQAYGYLSFTLLHQNYLGFSASADENFRRATEAAIAAIKLDETDPLPHGVLARIFAREGRYDDAVNEARLGVELNPNDALAQHALNVVCQWSDRFAEAKEPNERAMRLSPNDPMMHMFLTSKGNILYEMGEHGEGIKAVRAACRMPRNDYRMWLMLAAYLAETGEVDEAHVAARKVLEIRPDFTYSAFRESFQPEWHPDLHDRTAKRLRAAGLPA